MANARPHELTLLLPEGPRAPKVESDIQTFVAAIFAIARTSPASGSVGADNRAVIGLGGQILESLERNQQVWQATSAAAGRRVLLIEWIAIAGSIVILWGMTMFAFVPLLRPLQVAPKLCAASSMTGMPCRAAIALMASKSAHWPNSDTAMTALVRGVMAASSSAGSKL